MRIITRESNAASVSKRWNEQYFGNAKSDIGKRLAALGANPTPDDVSFVIGNTLWTRTECDECGAADLPVVQLGQEPDYESSTACICKSCLADAINLG